MDADFAMYQELLKTENPNAGVMARFYDRAIKTEKIDEQGLPVFVNQTFIEIRLKDNTTEVFDQPADEEKKKRFELEYARYKLAKKQTADGTALEMFAFLDASEIAALKERGIFTVEALAGLKKEDAGNLGIEREKDLADKFLALQKDNSVLNEFAKKEAAYKAEIAKLQDEIKELKKKG